ncbi:MAG: NUDIX domain-containing protein [Clostridiales bacterium]|nr:NUDIX domain-containing protein [Clostridiales bacterium]
MNIRNMTALYIIHENKILLMYKQKSRAFKNPLWVSVGGHFEEIDNGNPLECMKREMFEEINITMDDLQEFKLRYITLRKAKDELRNQYIYIAKLKEGVKVPNTTDEGILKWIDIEDLFNRTMSVTNTALLKHYFDIGIKTKYIYGGMVTQTDSDPYVEFTELREFDTIYK